MAAKTYIEIAVCVAFAGASCGYRAGRKYGRFGVALWTAVGAVTGGAAGGVTSGAAGVAAENFGRVATIIRLKYLMWRDSGDESIQ